MGTQVVRFTKEVAYNTFPGSPATGTQQEFFLPTSNAMTVLPKPQFWTISDAGVSNRVVEMNVGRIDVGGDLQTYMLPSQIAYLASLFGLTGSAPCYDIPSFSIDRGIWLEDGSCGQAFRRYTGCKLGSMTFSADQTAQGSLFMVKASILGSTPRAITSTDFPAPLLTAYPLDDPYLFYQSAGKLLIDGTARTNYQNVTITVDNAIKGFPDESRYLGRVGWFGRKVTFSVKLLYKSPADRLAYEAGAAHALSFGVDNGVTSVLFDLGTNVKLSDVSDDLPIDDFFSQTLTWTALMDRSKTPPTDLTVTVTTD